MDNVAARTAKSAVNAVPVVGDILTGAVDIVTYWTSAVRSGVAVALIIAVAAALIVPAAKLAACSDINPITPVRSPIMTSRLAVGSTIILTGRLYRDTYPK